MKRSPLRQTLEDLDRQAVSALRLAYAPYSRFRVGAAILTADHRIHIGANLENASYPVGLCAERAALAVAMCSGSPRTLLAIAIATPRVAPVFPCGMCRQALAEHGHDMEVRLVTKAGFAEKTKLSRLLPHAFDPKALRTP